MNLSYVYPIATVLTVSDTFLPFPQKSLNCLFSHAAAVGRPPGCLLLHAAYNRSQLQWCIQKIGSVGDPPVAMSPPIQLWMLLCGFVSSSPLPLAVPPNAGKVAMFRMLVMTVGLTNMLNVAGGIACPCITVRLGSSSGAFQNGAGMVGFFDQSQYGRAKFASPLSWLTISSK